MALPRGTCPVCGRDVALRKGNVAREHVPLASASGTGITCPGSGKVAVGDQWVMVTASVTVAVAEHRDDALRDAENLVADAIHPQVRSITNWDNRFVIVTAFSTSAERIAEPPDAYKQS